MNARLLRRWLTALALSLPAAACDSDPVRFVAATTIAKVSGDGQELLLNAPSQPLVVLVTDSAGQPVAGITVSFYVTSGSATVNSPSATTDAQGRAATTVTATSLQPATVIIEATAQGYDGAPLVFTGTVTLIAQVGRIEQPYVHDTFVRDGLAFVSAWNTGLVIYDVGNGRNGGTPAQPVHVSTVVTGNAGVSGGARVHNAWWFWNPNGLKQYLFVGQEGPGTVGSSSTGDIHVVDVSNLAAPVEVAFFHMQPVDGQPAGPHNFWIDEPNQVLYAAYYNGGVVALDVSGTLSGDLAQKEIARIRPGSINTYTWGVQYHNGSLYATDMVSGFYQLTRNGSSLTVAAGGNNVPERFGSDQWVHGSVAYSGTWGTRNGVRGNALKIWALGAGGAPVLVDSIITPNIGTVSDVEVSADGALLMFSAESGTGSGLYFYRLTNPQRPTFITHYSVPGGVHTATFATIGSRRYVFAMQTSGSPAVLILDATSLTP
jgi:hypothetical protein